MFGALGLQAGVPKPPAVSQKNVVVKAGTAPATLQAKNTAIVNLEIYLGSTQGAGGHNYPSNHEHLSGDIVCNKVFWEGLAGCALTA
jgi:hypothetical protein